MLEGCEGGGGGWTMGTIFGLLTAMSKQGCLWAHKEVHKGPSLIFLPVASVAVYTLQVCMGKPE